MSPHTLNTYTSSAAYRTGEVGLAHRMSRQTATPEKAPNTGRAKKKACNTTPQTNKSNFPGFPLRNASSAWSQYQKTKTSRKERKRGCARAAIFPTHSRNPCRRAPLVHAPFHLFGTCAAKHGENTDGYCIDHSKQPDSLG